MVDEVVPTIRSDNQVLQSGPTIRLQVLLTLTLSIQTLPIAVVYAMFLEHPRKELIGTQVEYISQWEKHETCYKFARISG